MGSWKLVVLINKLYFTAAAEEGGNARCRACRRTRREGNLKRKGPSDPHDPAEAARAANRPLAYVL